MTPTPKIIGYIHIPAQTTLNTEQITTLRRRVADKMCKNKNFCLSIIQLALQQGAVKHHDIMAHEELNNVLVGKF